MAKRPKLSRGGWGVINPPRTIYATWDRKFLTLTPHASRGEAQAENARAPDEIDLLEYTVSTDPHEVKR